MSTFDDKARRAIIGVTIPTVTARKIYDFLVSCHDFVNEAVCRTDSTPEYARIQLPIPIIIFEYAPKIECVETSRQNSVALSPILASV